MLFLIFMFCIALSLSYFLLWLIYRKLFKSQKKISKFLAFLVSIGLIIFYYTSYSYYLEPSFYEFREICQLDPEIYQANGGKIDEEYYNKVLRHFDMSWDAMDWKDIQQKSRINDYGDFLYKIKKYDNRVYYSFTLFFKNNQARRDNIEEIMLYANWDKMRHLPAGNEGTGFFLGSIPISCIYFKKD